MIAELLPANKTALPTVTLLETLSVLEIVTRPVIEVLAPVIETLDDVLTV